MKNLLLLIPLALLSCSESEPEGTKYERTGEPIKWTTLHGDPWVGYCVNPETGERVYVMSGYKKGGIFVAPAEPKR